MSEDEVYACPVCERRVSKDAHTCPGCGKVFRSWFWRWGWWVLGLTFFAVCVGLAMVARGAMRGH